LVQTRIEEIRQQRADFKVIPFFSIPFYSIPFHSIPSDRGWALLCPLGLCRASLVISTVIPMLTVYRHKNSKQKGLGGRIEKEARIIGLFFFLLRC
jgi:hypothetical protein